LTQNSFLTLSSYLFDEISGRWRNSNNQSSLLKLHHYTGTKIQTRWYLLGNDDRKLYGTIETNSNPWDTNPWKDLETKDEIGTMKLISFVNFCDEAPSSIEMLQHLFDSVSPTIPSDFHTLEELVLRALLILPNQYSLFSSPSSSTPLPVNCLNFLLSSSSGLTFTFPPLIV
jgi:hypothetical protein